MEWNEKLQKIIDYVEEHLQRTEEPIDTTEITQLAGCSYTFFQKVFSYMNGISFAEYIRWRKLTLAGYDLKSTDIKVIDLSYKYGYDSPTSFTKAFQQFHGLSPSEARMTDTPLRVMPKMQIAAKTQYSWRIEHKPAMRLIGKSIRLPRESNLKAARIPEFWNECQRNGLFSHLISMDTSEAKGLFGLFADREGTEYSIMVHSDRKLPLGYEEKLVPEVTWAVFDCRGPVPQAIQRGWRYLTEEWLLQYPFAHADCPELEWYSSGNAYDEQYLSQIWIPIITEE